MKRGLLTLLACSFMIGCASPKSVSESAPPDFGLSFTVLRPHGDMKAAWYVMQPDGVLRAVEGVRREDTPIPPPVRVLNEAERTALWNIVRKSYWLSGFVPTGFKVAPELDAIDIAVSVTGDDQRSTLIGPVENAAVAEFESMLRELAWLNEGT